MSKKLFVGNLSWSTNDKDLKDHFKQYGEVLDAKIITDKATGKSRGFGFVEMNSAEEAKKAVEEAKEKEPVLDGRSLRVSLADDNRQEGGRDRGQSSFGNRGRGDSRGGNGFGAKSSYGNDRGNYR